MSLFVLLDEVIDLYVDQHIALDSLGGILLAEHSAVLSDDIEQIALIIRQQQLASCAGLRQGFLYRKQQVVKTVAVLCGNLDGVFLL